jgi:hypothetical protein
VRFVSLDGTAMRHHRLVIGRYRAWVTRARPPLRVLAVAIPFAVAMFALTAVLWQDTVIFRGGLLLGLAFWFVVGVAGGVLAEFFIRTGRFGG